MSGAASRPRVERAAGARGRFSELDGLRGIAAAAVVLCHFTDYTLYPGDNHIPWFFRWGQFGVQLFFMISGFVILVSARNSPSARHFAITRFSRLYPPYWIALALSTFLVLRVHVHAAIDPVTWKTALINITMLQRWLNKPSIDSVYWTLGVELQFYVVMGVLIWVLKGRLTARRMATVALAVCALSLAVAMWAYPRSHDINPINVDRATKFVLNGTITPYGSLFAIGMLAYLARSRELSWVPAILAALSSVIQYALVQSSKAALVVAFLAAVFLLVARRERTPVLTNRLTTQLGRHSYSLYIGHMAVGLFVCHALNGPLGPYGALAVALLVVAAWTVVLHRVGEELLSQKVRSMLLRTLGPRVGGRHHVGTTRTHDEEGMTR